MFFTLVLKLSNKFINLILSQSRFKFLQTLGNLRRSKLSSCRFTGFPLTEESFVGQALLQHHRVNLDVSVIDPVLVLLDQQ